jgi:hypothetical protein
MSSSADQTGTITALLFKSDCIEAAYKFCRVYVAGVLCHQINGDVDWIASLVCMVEQEKSGRAPV